MSVTYMVDLLKTMEFFLWHFFLKFVVVVKASQLKMAAYDVDISTYRYQFI